MFTVKKNKIENGHDCWGRSEFDNVYDVYHNNEFVCRMMSDPTELINKVNNIVKKERGREKMKFSEAFEAMKQGAKVKLPRWGGFWFWDPKEETIMIQCRPQGTEQGELLDIRETQKVENTLMNMQSDEWEIADAENCEIMSGKATFPFGDAIKYMKRGLKVARKGWNGKKQYIQLASGISYKTAEGEIVNCEHDAIGNKAVAFVGTSGVQMGWLASQADMLAEDWTFVE